HPLDHHVVERDRLDQRVAIVRLAAEPVDAGLQQAVEELTEGVAQVLLESLESLRELGRVLEDADLAEEAIEEADVARLVGDLGGEEDPLLFGGGGPHDRPELVGDLLLADEEAREPVHALEALLLRDALMPVDPVL